MPLQRTVVALAALSVTSSCFAQQWTNEATVTIGTWQWLGPGRQFHGSLNWYLGGIGQGPNTALPVYVGPIEEFVSGIPTGDFLIPASIPLLSSSFSSPSVAVIAMDVATGLEIDRATYEVASQMVIGTTPPNDYEPGEVIPSQIILRDGYVEGTLIVGYDSDGQLDVFGRGGTPNLSLAVLPGSTACVIFHPGASFDRFGSVSVGQGTVQVKNSAGLSIADTQSIQGPDLTWSNNPGSQLTIGGTLGVGGTLTNATRIDFAGSNENRIEVLDVFGTVSLVGGGVVVMVEGGDSQIGTGTADEHLINVDNVISGAGTFRAAVTNQNVIRVENGIMDFRRDVDNASGTILVAPNGELRGSRVIGGTLGTVPQSRVGTTLRNVTIPGVLSVGDDSKFGPLLVEESIINTGTITFVGDRDSDLEQLDILGTVSLLGGGNLVMVEGTDSQIGNGTADEHLINADNVISGAGTFRAALTNQDLVRVENGTMTFNRDVDNTAGTIEVLAGGSLRGGRVIGGTLEVAADGRVGTTLQNVRLTGTLSVADDAEVGVILIEESITNTGTITFVGDPDSDLEQLDILGTVSLLGGGDLVMVESTDSQIGNGTADEHLINVDNVISGAGTLRAALTNQNLVRVENGTMTLNRDTDNSAGEIQVTSSGVLRGGRVIGGTIDAASDGRVGTTLQNVTLTGVLTVADDAEVGAILIEQSIINTGTITFVGDPDSDLEQLDVAGTITLLGGGNLVMVEGTDSQIGNGTADEHLINVDNVISGAGTFRAAVTNQHVIRAENGIMTLNRDVDNTSGTILVAPSGELRGGRVIGGTLGTTLQSRVGSTLQDVTIPGVLAVGDDSKFGALLIEDSITNTGTITFVGDRDSDLEQLDILGTVSLLGGGDLVMVEGTDSQIGNGTADEHLINVDNIISGTGTFRAALTNQNIVRVQNGTMAFQRDLDSSMGEIQILSGGTLAFSGPELAASSIVLQNGGTFNLDGGRAEIAQFVGDFSHTTGRYAVGLGTSPGSVSGTYDLGRNARVEIEIGGANPGEFDQLSVGGDVSLTGQLETVALNGFTASPNQRFPIISVGGTLTGTFNGLAEGALVTNLGEDVFITYLGGDGNDIELYTSP